MKQYLITYQATVQQVVEAKNEDEALRDFDFTAEDVELNGLVEIEMLDTDEDLKKEKIENDVMEGVLMEANE